MTWPCVSSAGRRRDQPGGSAFALLHEGTDVPPKVSDVSHPGAARRAAPHPRAAVSGRMSAADFRAMQGRSAGGARKQHGQASKPQPTLRTETLRAAIRRASTESRPIGKPRELPIEIILPFAPPSVNSLFATVTDERTGRPKRVLSSAARNARRAISAFVYGYLSRDEIYELHITVELPVLTKEGKLAKGRRVDLTNRVKFLEDCVSKCLGIDDALFFRVILDKVHAEHERTIVRILKYRNRPERGRRAEDASVARGARAG
jgi:Holliday junction resolvase RusA-like endonuclease